MCKRGDIYYVDFGEKDGSKQGGVRPALVVSNNKGKISEGTSFVCSVLKGRSCSDSNRGRSYQTAPW